MSTNRLTRAARVLRERAGGTTWVPECGGWWFVGMGTNAVAEADTGVASASSEGVARFIATMHPGVALALADWLAVESANDGHLPHRFPKDAPAEVISWKCQECGELINEMHTQASPCLVDWRPRNPFAVRVADLILGTES